MSNINTWPGWECVRQLGAGAFGKVYEIKREENGKVYKAALKVISIPQNEADVDNAYSEGMSWQDVTDYFQSFVNDFTNEIALMSDLKGYTNIVSYEDHMVIPHENSVGWDILIRMELLTPLQKWAMDHPLSEADVIRLGCDICTALTLCHKNKIIHRDIKPENIFVNKNGDFKLGDFGIARVIEKTASVMSQKGTYTYMAPEVFKSQHYDETADLYSLGLVLYRFLNENRTPFLPMGKLQYADRQIAQEKRMSGEVIHAPQNGSDELKEIILKALQYDPANRFRSAKEMKKALEKFEDDELEKESPIQTKETIDTDSQNEQKDEEKTVFSGFTQYVENQTYEDYEEETQFEEEKTVVTPRSIPQNVSKKTKRNASEKKRRIWLVPVGVISVLAVVILIVAFNTKVVRPVDYYLRMHTWIGNWIEIDEDEIAMWASLDDNKMQEVLDDAAIPAKAKAAKKMFNKYLSMGDELGTIFFKAEIIEVYKFGNITVSIADMDYSSCDARMIIIYKDDIAVKVIFR